MGGMVGFPCCPGGGVQGLQLLLAGGKGLGRLFQNLLRGNLGAHGGAEVVGAGGGTAGGLIGIVAAVVKAGTKGTVAGVVQLVHKGGGLFPADFSLQGIDGLAIGTGHQSHVVDAFHAALHLEGVNAGSPHVLQMVNHAQVLGGEDGGKVLPLKDGEVLAGPLPFLQHQGSGLGQLLVHHGTAQKIDRHLLTPLLCGGMKQALLTGQGLGAQQVEVPAAGVGAGPAVGAAAGQVGAQQAAAGVGDAHGSMPKGLQLHLRHGILDFTNLFQGGFPPQHHPLESQLAVELHRLAVDAVGLGAQVERRLGKVLLDEVHHADVLDDEGIDGIAAEVVQLAEEFVYVLVVESDVQGAEELFVRMLLLQPDDALVFLLVKIVSLHSQREILQSDVGGIRPVGVGVVQLVVIACWCNKFHHSVSWSLVLLIFCM